MRLWPRTVSILSAVALCGWAVSDREQQPLPQTAKPKARAKAAVVAEIPIRAISSLDTPGIHHHSARNLFVYREAAVKPGLRVAAIVHTPPPVVVEPAPVVDAEPPQPAAPRFTHQLIGTFGSRDVRFAVFTRDGEVVNAKPGDRIDGDFVLHSIGLESVKVQAIASGSVLPISVHPSSVPSPSTTSVARIGS